MRVTHRTCNPFRDVWMKSSQRSGKADCEQGWYWYTSDFPDYDIWYALSGKGKIQINNQSYSIRKGACFMLRPGDEVYATQDNKERLTIIFVHFSLVRLELGKAIDTTILPPSCTYIKETHQLEEYLHRLVEIDESNDMWKEEEFNCVLKQVFIHLHRINASLDNEFEIPLKHKRIINKVVEYLRMRRTNQSVSSRELSKLVNISAQYLARIFKQYTGYSLKEYAQQVKMERAMHLLTETSMNVTQISEAIGYADIYSFSKQFKQFYGQSPSLFRSKSYLSKPHYGNEWNDKGMHT